jgi:hypothetical protein
MDDILNAFVKSAIEQLGGSRRFVPGAVVASVAKRLAAEAGVDMPAELRSAGVKFGDVVRALANKDTQVRLQTREGSDFLIGFDSAESQLTNPELGRIRKDFYDAFTLLDQPQLYYHPTRDEITQADGDGAVPLPRPLKEEAVALRNDFAKELPPGDVQDRLITALASDNELSKFSKVVMTYQLSESWRAFR